MKRKAAFDEKASEKKVKATKPAQSDDADSKYCTCEDAGEGLMIECAIGVHCGGWVHVKCEGLNKRDVTEIGEDDYV